jgi:hypothetical protein
MQHTPRALARRQQRPENTTRSERHRAPPARAGRGRICRMDQKPLSERSEAPFDLIRERSRA